MTAVKPEKPKQPTRATPRIRESVPRLPTPRAPVKPAALVIPRPRGK